MNKYFLAFIFMILSMTLHALEITEAPASGDELILVDGQIELFGSYAQEIWPIIGGF